MYKMRIGLFLVFSIAWMNALAQSDELLLERELYNLPGVTFKKTSEPGDKYLKHDLIIQQPLDH